MEELKLVLQIVQLITSLVILYLVKKHFKNKDK